MIYFKKKKSGKRVKDGNKIKWIIPKLDEGYMGVNFTILTF